MVFLNLMLTKMLNNLRKFILASKTKVASKSIFFLLLTNKNEVIYQNNMSKKMIEKS